MTRARFVIVVCTTMVLGGCGERGGSEPSAESLQLVRSLAGGADAAYQAHLDSLEPGDILRGPKVEWSIHKKYVIDRLVANPDELEIAAALAVEHSDSETIPGAAGTVSGHFLAVCTVWALVMRNDDAGLVRLLSRVPMEVVGPDGVYIEAALLGNFERGTVDGFAVLFDAYDASNDQGVRSVLAGAARRAFWSELQGEPDDSAAVAKARELFQRCRGSVKVNHAYFDSYRLGVFDVGEAKGVALFIPHESPDSVRGEPAGSK